LTDERVAAQARVVLTLAVDGSRLTVDGSKKRLFIGLSTVNRQLAK
jgi:hypothetical protein